jgi:NAD(P)-dependent dehydrogenase (short-subunit alcohol dehydrogenase family)
LPVRASSPVLIASEPLAKYFTDFSDAEKTRLKDEIPLGRFGDPREVADAAVFLAQNEYANNCILNLDGGLSAI